jgi:hypothetical protein
MVKIINQRVFYQELQKLFCVIKASSHIIKDAACISSHKVVPCFILHVVVSSKLSHEILKRECVVQPPGRSREATPDEATDKTIFLRA